MLIRLRNQLYDYTTPLIMGILNHTEDSFFDGGKYLKESAVIKQTQTLLDEGADIIDIGLMSTKPGSNAISEELELERLAFVLDVLSSHFENLILSIDSYRSKTVDYALNNGVSIVNDISGGAFDPELWNVVAQNHAPYILMHTSSLPCDMQEKTDYQNVVSEILRYFSEKIALLQAHDIYDIILDPGFGFGKTLEQNYLILKHIDFFKIFDLPVLVGVSRKSMIYKLLESSPEEALNGTSVLHTLAFQKDVHIFRVHDVKTIREVKKMYEFYVKS